jgi:glucokinase
MMNSDKEQSWVVGVDVGGSHICACVIDAGSGELYPDSSSLSAVDSSKGADELVSTWTETILSSMRAVGFPIRRIGIAMPGPFDYVNGVSLMSGLGKFDRLYGFNVKAALASRLSVGEGAIRMGNDATCFLHGELRVGHAKGCRSAIGITLGTGLGSCVYRNGMTVDGDLWRFPFSGGIAEDRISSRWILGRYQAIFGESAVDVKSIVDMAANDPTVEEIFQGFGRSLGTVIALRYRDEMPEKLIFTGGLTGSWHLFSAPLVSALSEAGFNVPLDVSRHQEFSAMVGAAMLWSDRNTM